MKRTYNLLIGPQTAENIKIEIGSAAPQENDGAIEVKGRDMISGLPRKALIKAEEVREALKEPVGQIVDAVLQTLEHIEPELAADLVDNGVHLVGGGAMLRGLAQVITKATGLEVKVVDDPLTCVARGTSQYLDFLDEWRGTLESDEDEF
jgi:rod shape-determining protein MreB